ncbi:MAG: hypothetical protein MK108_12705 [Mariniblastus sp.]|nr:hypothetical protein [Mariniblastus sp.]
MLIIAVPVVMALMLAGCSPNSPKSEPAAKSEPAVDTLSAAQVIERVAQTYAQCKTYTDTGTHTSVMTSKSGEETEVLQFSTAMVRHSRSRVLKERLVHDQFRFEYSEKGKPGRVVWKSGQEVKVSMAAPPEANQSLALALAFFTGISDGTAHTIPALLMPSEVTGIKLTDIRKPVRGEDQSIDGRNCFSIQGKLPEGRTTIWIDQESFLVRRIEQSYPLVEGVTVAERTDYQPVINQDVAAKRLEYNPPK